MYRNLLLRLLAFLPAILGMQVSLMAQMDRATMVGRVVDPTGSIVSGAMVSVKRVATNEVSSTRTTDSGDFTVVNLPPDVYDITVSNPGFRRDTKTGIRLEVGRTMRIDFTLQV